VNDTPPVQLDLFDSPEVAKYNEGVKLLAARMESNPEEFWEIVSKWYWVCDGIENDLFKFLTQPEKEYLKQKLVHAQRDNFTAQVLKTLTNSP